MSHVANELNETIVSPSPVGLSRLIKIRKHHFYPGFNLMGTREEAKKKIKNEADGNRKTMFSSNNSTSLNNAK